MIGEKKTERLRFLVTSVDRKAIEKRATEADLPIAVWLRQVIRNKWNFTTTSYKNKTEQLHIPLSPKDRKLIEKRAAKADLRTGAWLRQLVREELYGCEQRE